MASHVASARFEKEAKEDRKRSVGLEDDSEDGEDIEILSGSGSEGEGVPLDGGHAAFARAFVKVIEREGNHDKVGLVAYTEQLKRRRKKNDQEGDQEIKESRKRKERLERKKRGRTYPTKAGEDPTSDQKERQLRKIATRGVVTLFNAVAKAQKVVEENKDRPSTAASLTKATFLAEIRGSGEGEGKGRQDVSDASKGGWDVLQEGYKGFGTGKLKDMEKQMESDASEEGLDSDLMESSGETASDTSDGEELESEVEDELVHHFETEEENESG